MNSKASTFFIRLVILLAAILLTLKLTSCSSGDDKIGPTKTSVTYTVTAKASACLFKTYLMGRVDEGDVLDDAALLDCDHASKTVTLAKGQLLEIHVFAETGEAYKGADYIFTITQDGKTAEFEADYLGVKFLIK